MYCHFCSLSSASKVAFHSPNSETVDHFPATLSLAFYSQLQLIKSPYIAQGCYCLPLPSRPLSPLPRFLHLLLLSLVPSTLINVIDFSFLLPPTTVLTTISYPVKLQAITIKSNLPLPSNFNPQQQQRFVSLPTLATR